MKIAVLEDDKYQADFIKRTVTSAGHHCEAYASPAHFFSAFRQHTFDLLIVDWNLPEMSGLEVIERLQSREDRRVPILMLTSRSHSNEIVRSLRAGADDFVTKPVTEDVLLARIEAIVRRRYEPNPQGDSEHCGAYKFIKSTRTISVNGVNKIVTAREFDLALLFFHNIGRPLSRSYIMDMLWSSNPEVNTRTLDTHVARIRTKLEIYPDVSGYSISTIYGFGYRMDKVGDGEQLTD